MFDDVVNAENLNFSVQLNSLTYSPQGYRKLRNVVVDTSHSLIVCLRYSSKQIQNCFLICTCDCCVHLLTLFSVLLEIITIIKIVITQIFNNGIR